MNFAIFELLKEFLDSLPLWASLTYSREHEPSDKPVTRSL